jgi:hypothetical protein
VQSRDEEDEADFFPVSGIPSGGGGSRPRFPPFSFPSHPFSSLLTLRGELGATKMAASGMKRGVRCSASDFYRPSLLVVMADGGCADLDAWRQSGDLEKGLWDGHWMVRELASSI